MNICIQLSNGRISGELTFTDLKGYSGIRLRDNTPLEFKSGINLVVGRNGCGKSNLLRLIQQICVVQGEFGNRIESSYLFDKYKGVLASKDIDWEKRKLPSATIASFKLKDVKCKIKLDLTRGDKPHVLYNILKKGKNFQGHVSLNYTQQVKATCTFIYGNQSVPKFEASSYLLNSNLFSHDPSNRAHALMKEPVQLVSDFIRRKLIEFFRSKEFIENIKKLELSINDKFSQFLGSTDKQANINYDEITTSGEISLSLTDRDNYINSEDLSTGESILFNLIFYLMSARLDKSEFLILDEPEIHMHDDMIQILVNELVDFNKSFPSCSIIIATHSTAFIEQLACLGKDMINIITFDRDRKVGNSQKDIDLINALHRNGVMFSPLMLSRTKNLFIENQARSGKSHKEFFLKFFSSDNLPNVIPIGNSGNVEDSESFTTVLEEIVSTSSISSVGIRDGDMWFKLLLEKYLLQQIELNEFLKTIGSNEGAYIRGQKANSYYFNFWEIENLYLINELLPYWKNKNADSLNADSYTNLLSKNKHIVYDCYLKTFIKTQERVRLADKSLAKAKLRLEKQYESIHQTLSDTTIEKRIHELIDVLLKKGLMNWIPGKEVRNLLIAKGYSFNIDSFDFEESRETQKIRMIME